MARIRYALAPRWAAARSQHRASSVLGAGLANLTMVSRSRHFGVCAVVIDRRETNALWSKMLAGILPAGEDMLAYPA
jgi:hypothetical protein